MIDKNITQKYKRPSQEYLEATCKTISAGLFLRLGPFEDKEHPIKLKVFNGAEIKEDAPYETFASMKYLF